MRMTSKGSLMRRRRSGPRSANCPASLARASRSGVASRRAAGAESEILGLQAVLDFFIPPTPRRVGRATCNRKRRVRATGAAEPNDAARRHRAGERHGRAGGRANARRRRRRSVRARFGISARGGARGHCPSLRLLSVAGKKGVETVCSWYVLLFRTSGQVIFLKFMIAFVLKSRIMIG